MILRRCVLLAALAAAPALAQDSPAAWLAELDRIGHAIAQARCARPQEAKSNRVGETQDEMRSVDCRDFRIALYVSRSGEAERESPMALVVLGPHPALPAGLAVGAGIADVQALLGAPARQHGESLVYAPRRGDSISFEASAGRVRAIAWNWEVD